MIYKDVLEEYLDNNTTIKQISDYLSKSEGSVRYWMKKYDLESRNKKMSFRYSDDDLLNTWNNTETFSDFIRAVNGRVNGGTYYHYKKRMISIIGEERVEERLKSGRSKGGKISSRKSNEKAILKKQRLPRKVLKKSMDLSNVDYKCSNSDCGVADWLGREITLQIDHIDGDPTNNHIDNLRYLCPNCHTQTPTWGMKNRGEIIPPKICPICNEVEITSRAEKCLSCHNKTKITKKKFEISEEELYQKVCIEKLAFTKLGEMYNVSDNAFRKRCKSYGIDPKTREYKQ